MCLKEKCAFPVLTYGSDTLTLKPRTDNKIKVTQRAMERSMMGISYECCGQSNMLKWKKISTNEIQNAQDRARLMSSR